MKNKERLAEDFCNREGLSWENEYAKESFLEGFRAKENIIKETLKTLQQLIDSINNLSLTEQVFKSRDLDRLNNKIEVLQSLL
jgi:hypothetical protein